MAEYLGVHRRAVWAVAIVLCLLLLRLFYLTYFPLYDTTEARYAEIARIMHETGNWVTPHIDYQQPFWGKPPGHTWMSAGGFMVLGVSAFAARLPHFLCGLGVLLLVYLFASYLKPNGRSEQNPGYREHAGLLSVLVLTSSMGFFIAMGMVMTDIALTMSVTLAMISFWKVWVAKGDGFHGHLFFAALAMGMLVKGPVAIILVGIALFVWCVWQKTLLAAVKSLPWLTGIPLFFALTLPWYVWAELRTPGFLEYFILGEHFQRFLVAGWEGDLYGTAHDKPRGMIWLFWLAAAFPWSVILLAKSWHLVRKNQGENAMQIASGGRTITPYLVSWMIAPMVLFTLAGNILMAYVLPGFAAMAVLYALHSHLNRNNLVVAGGCLAVFMLPPLARQLDVIDKTSEVELIGQHATQSEDKVILYWKKRPFSASFYSAGQARLIEDEKTLLALASGPDKVFIAAQHQHFHHLYKMLNHLCIEQAKTKERFLLKCKKTDHWKNGLLEE